MHNVTRNISYAEFTSGLFSPFNRDAKFFYLLCTWNRLCAPNGWFRVLALFAFGMEENWKCKEFPKALRHYVSISIYAFTIRWLTAPIYTAFRAHGNFQFRLEFRSELKSYQRSDSVGFQVNLKLIIIWRYSERQTKQNTAHLSDLFDFTVRAHQ